MNEIIFFVEILVAFSAVTVCAKFFGEKGLTAWVCIASVLANLLTAKSGEIFGMNAALGTVLFATTFLATDILCEKYGKKAARQAVIMGVLSTVTFIIASQIRLLYIPSEFDYAHGAMQTLFGLNLRISVASVVMYAVANLADVYIFDRIKRATGGRFMWLRNNVATIVCNCLENFAFIFLAFLGIYDAVTCLEIALTTSLIEIIAAVCDTPFLYLATGSRKRPKAEKTK